MAAILTDRFRVLLARKFKDNIADGENVSPKNPTVWLFFAKAKQWDVTTDPDDPIDNQDAAFAIYDQIIGLKRVSSSEIRPVIRNKTWTTGTTYDIYRHDYGNVIEDTGTIVKYVQSASFEQHLYETDYYVVNSEYKVYKCLKNNNNQPSTIEPFSTSNAPFTLADGYMWKYMYTINANDFEKFKTDEYIPIPEITDIVENNKITATNKESNPGYGGAIYNVLIDAQGFGYQSGQEFDIIGDGEGGRIRITGVTDQGGITSISVLNPGVGYTYGQINPTGGTNAILKPIISPKEGIAVDIGLELGAYRLALHTKLEKDDFTFGNDFSVIGLIWSPSITASSDLLAIGTKQMVITGQNNGGLQLAAEQYNDAQIEVAGGGGATGRIVHYEAANGVYTIYYTQENEVGYGVDTSGVKREFEPGDQCIIDGGEQFTIASDADAVKDSELVRGSGEIIYIDNRNTISRAEDQTEDFKIILEF
jgi:hypothetical protein